MITAEQKLKEAESIIREFKAMRILQKDYYRAVYEKDEVRKNRILPQSKAQEKKVDEMISIYYQLNFNG